MTSKRDLKRYSKLVEYGCVCCKILGVYSVPEMHHIVDRGYRKHSGGNASTIPLCPPHHRGHSTPIDIGPSLANGSKPFAAHWGTERELLAMVDADIGAK